MDESTSYTGAERPLEIPTGEAQIVITLGSDVNQVLGGKRTPREFGQQIVEDFTARGLPVQEITLNDPTKGRMTLFGEGVNLGSWEGAKEAGHRGGLVAEGGETVRPELGGFR